LGAAELRRAVPSGKLCDGLVLYGDAVVLVESKAKLLKLSARAGEDIAEYETKLDEIVVDGGEQLLDTIQAVETGSLRNLGVAPDHIRAYYPLFATLDSIPMRTPIYNRLVSHLPPLPEAAQGKLRPLQIVDVGELEMIELAVRDRAFSLRDTLERKSSDDTWRGEPMTNFAHAVNETRVLEGHNPYLATLYRQIGERARSFLRSRVGEGSEVSHE